MKKNEILVVEIKVKINDEEIAEAIIKPDTTEESYLHYLCVKVTNFFYNLLRPTENWQD